MSGRGATSPEHRAKIAAALRGRPRSAEAIANLRAAIPARSAALTDEARERMRQGARRKVWTDDARVKCATAAKGHAVSAETRAKISATAKGRVISDATRAKLSASAKNRVVSEATREKLSAASKGRPVSDATRAKLSASNAARVQTEAFRAKMREVALARPAHSNLRQNAAPRVAPVATPRKTPWLADRVTMLTALWADGTVTAQIARDINAAFGTCFGKNAIIGKVDRLGLPKRPNPSLPGGNAGRVRSGVPVVFSVEQPASARVAKPVPKPRIVPPPRRPADQSCCWPTEVNGRQRMVCEGLAERGKPYCAEHLAEAYTTPQLRPSQQEKLAAQHG